MATYKIVSHGGNGLPLNVETTSTISGRTNVNIWKDTGSNDQKWSINSLGTSQAAHRTHSSMVHQSIMQKSILTKKRKDTVSTIRMASITREKTDGMTAFTKIIRSRNIRWKAAGKSRLAQARRSQLLSDVQSYSVWCLV